MKLEVDEKRVKNFIKQALREAPIFQKGDLKFVLVGIYLDNEEQIDYGDWDEKYFPLIEKVVFNVKGLHKTLSTLVEVYPSGTVVVSPCAGRDIEKLKSVF